MSTTSALPSLEDEEDHSYASRLSLITYPELFICSKAGECKWSDQLCYRHHGAPHAERANCHVPNMDCDGATCIPYVPEDEAREWVVVFGHAIAALNGSGTGSKPVLSAGLTGPTSRLASGRSQPASPSAGGR